MSETTLDDLEAAVLEILRQHEGGISEFALFAKLAESGFAEFERDVFADRMRMFRSHFVLFHVLYSMRERLVMRREGRLSIEAVSIKLSAWNADGSSETQLAEHDPLRDYYLDPANLDTMTEAELRTMLDRFWERFAADDRRGEALRELGLSAAASWEDIKSRHRALVFEHHPDRGGDASRLAAINAAMRILEASSRWRR